LGVPQGFGLLTIVVTDRRRQYKTGSEATLKFLKFLMMQETTAGPNAVS
jgi:hypothetical protein